MFVFAVKRATEILSPYELHGFDSLLMFTNEIYLLTASMKNRSKENVSYVLFLRLG